MTIPTRTIRVSNIVDHERTDIATCVVPWPEGSYRGEPLDCEEGAACDAQVEPFGALWPDGSWRHARVSLYCTLKETSSKLFRLVPRPVFLGAADGEYFSLHDDVRSALDRFRIILQVGDKSAEVGGWEALGGGPLTQHLVGRCRVPGTPVPCEVRIEALSLLPHARFSLHWMNSDTTDPKVVHDLPPVTFHVEGAVELVWHRDAKMTQGAGIIADGQGQAFAGMLLFGNSPQHIPLLAGVPLLASCLDWPESKTFGPWGYVPEMPKEISESQAAAWAYAAEEYQPTEGDPWGSPVHGIGSRPGATGDQRGFSAVVCSQEARGWPTRLHAIQWSVYQEACRPTHVRDVEGRRVELHRVPGMRLWSGRPHIRDGAPSFGKERELADWDTRHTAEGKPWWGYDNEHWSPLYVCAYAQLTGDPWAVEECQHLADLWLGQTQHGGGLGPDRAIGRMLQAGAWLWLVTGRSDLERRARQLIQERHRQWKTQRMRQVVPLTTWPPHGHNLPKHRSWRPWAEAIALMGLDAADQVWDIPEARALIIEVGTTVLLYGFREIGGKLVPGHAVEWRDGIHAEDLKFRPLEDFDEDWLAPGVIAARRHLLNPAAAIADRWLAQDPPRDVRSIEWRAVR